MTNAITSSGFTAYTITHTRAPDTSKLQQQLFSKVDSNGDKSIDKAELTSFLDYVGEKTGQSVDSAAAFKALDGDSNGSISESELQDNASALFDQLRAQLMGAQMSAPPPPPPPEDPSDMFSSIDTDSDGSISKTELETFLSSRAEESGRTDGPSAEEILAHDDSDGDGSISSAEFEDAFKRGPTVVREGGSGPSFIREGGGGPNFEQLLSSLVSQYAAIGSSSSSSASSLSIAA